MAACAEHWLLGQVVRERVAWSLARKKPKEYFTDMSSQPVAFLFSDDGSIPNNDRLPFVVYRQVAEASAGATAFEELFSRNGWSRSWRNGVYDYHHYHSTAHEVLGVYKGSATILFGGERGKRLEISTGDVVVIPAGVGHKRVDSSPDFAVVGAYPDGQTNDL